MLIRTLHWSCYLFLLTGPAERVRQLLDQYFRLTIMKKHLPYVAMSYSVPHDLASFSKINLSYSHVAEYHYDLLSLLNSTWHKMARFILQSGKSVRLGFPKLLLVKAAARPSHWMLTCGQRGWPRSELIR